MMKLWGKKNKVIKESSTVDKAVQCDNNDPYVRLLILEKLPKFTDPSGENFKCYEQRLQIIMEALQIEEKDKVGFLLASLQGKAQEILGQSQLDINALSSWKNATTMLTKVFDPVQPPGNIQILRQLKQHDQDFTDFTNLVHQMVNKIFIQQLGYSDVQRESETIRYAIRGAQKELKDHLKGTKYNNIHDMTTKAQAFKTPMVKNGTKK